MKNNQGENKMSEKFLSYFPNENGWSATCHFCQTKVSVRNGWTFTLAGDHVTACSDCYRENHGATPTTYSAEIQDSPGKRTRLFECGSCAAKFGYVKSAKTGKWFAANARGNKNKIWSWSPHFATCGQAADGHRTSLISSMAMRKASITHDADFAEVKEALTMGNISGEEFVDFTETRMERITAEVAETYADTATVDLEIAVDSYLVETAAARK